MLNVILPVWATDEQVINITESAIQSLRVAPVKLIIIDNGSTFGSGALREWADLYIRNKENLGYAKAVNQGLKLAGQLVIVANNDIRISPNWYEVIKELNKWDTYTSLHFRMIPYDAPFQYGNDVWVEGKEKWCSSSFFLMPNIQLYDENFLNSCEDWDFWYRWRQQGYKTAYTNKASYQHMDSFTQNRRLDREENDKKNYEYYKEKHGEYPDIQFNQMYPEQKEAKWKPFP